MQGPQGPPGPPVYPGPFEPEFSGRGHRYPHHGHEYPFEAEEPERFYPPPHRRPHRPMHDYDFDSHDEFRQYDEFDRFSHHEYPRPMDEYPPHRDYPPFHEDYRRQPHDIYPRPHHDYPPPHDGYPRPMHGDESDRHRHSPSHSNDRLDDYDFRADDDGARKPANKLELPDTKSVDLASVQFPRRGELSLPDGPALDALHVNRRDEGPSPIVARNGLDLPEGQMDIANISPHRRDDLDIGKVAGGVL